MIHHAPPPCAHHRAIRRDRAVLVYSRYTGQKDLYGGRISNLYVCARPAGRTLRLAQVSTSVSPEYPPNEYLRRLDVAGPYAAAEVVAGAASYAACESVSADCPLPHVVITLAGPRRNRRATFTTPDGTGDLLLCKRGAAAWIEPSTPGPKTLVAVRLGGHARRLDSGQISFLRWHGLTLSWRNGTTQRSARIG